MSNSPSTKAKLQRLAIKHWLWRIKFYGGWTLVGLALLMLWAWSMSV